MKVTRGEIQEQVDKLLVESFELDPEDLGADANLFDDLGLDSLDAIDMLLAMETFIGTRLNDDDKDAAKQIRTVKDVVDFIEKIAARGESA